MSSGHGFNGGPSRCFGEWQRFIECYTSEETSHPVKCTPHADDYFECLHHNKERARVQMIQAQLNKNKADAKENGESPNSIVVTRHSLPETLGLIANDSTSKK
ncbi:hypothetical protein BN7_3833 [Wickerhamomyces ciferrii]|uniref:NADH dehydrogenase [ubiquinone] iron-sulfur protein 5 n=1 Tax=Wickerhamomyces ciferrii (strain ATCC 14091 / BCRC 22168 / CBS 111 / JCM 3599 / NBRC 0793 / NRRL Y-1031 F-60-10) TaxID=1206466 RepID=K0KQ50_WICCF|nr:uncharacterized protein BN7_3833 [Wickerhamomyces ciferrii]CCH44272.1 hypothetical protein BN7_3833 [Wickerhamomyces ciferrii]